MFTQKESHYVQWGLLLGVYKIAAYHTYLWVPPIEINGAYLWVYMYRLVL